MQMVLNPEVSIQELADVIKYDVGLSARIIQTANSAKFSANHQVADIETAIKTLGLSLLKNIVLSVSVIDMLDKNTIDEAHFTLISKYSIATATAAQKIGEKINFPHSGMTYLSGLMLYLSFFFLSSRFGQQFSTMLTEASERNIRISKIIEEKINISAFSISFEIANKWQLPKLITQSIYYQYNIPRQEVIDDNDLEKLIYIVNAASLATESFFGTGIKKTNMIQFENQAKELGINDSELLESTYDTIQTALANMQVESDGEDNFNKILVEANRELSLMNLKYESLYQEINDKNKELKLLNQKLRGKNNLLRSKIMFDDLTEVFNRRYFETEMERVFASQKRESQVICLLLLDIDNFKFINDTFGHQAGDQVLKQVALTIKEALRKEDIIARIGGDEFVVYPRNLKSEKDAAKLASTLIERFQTPVEYKNKQIHISLSIGISSYKGTDSSPTELLKDADIAMYQAKAKGKNGYYFFDEQLDQLSKKRIAIELSLSKGLERNEFRTLYQPIIRAADKTIHGVEALLRWKRPLIKEIMPNEFIPHLEANGQIIRVGRWVAENVIKQIGQWQDQIASPLQYHINVSSKQLDDNEFAAHIQQTLAEHHVRSNQLAIELTESALYENAKQVDTILNELDSMQVSCSIDDFGTGYSSLIRLKELPFKSIKIDRTFISTMFDDVHSKHIIESIIFLAKRLNLSTIAEGVENIEEFEQLKAWGCDYIQGYLFAKPLEADAFLEFAKAHSKNS